MQLPALFTVLNTTSSASNYSCVAKAGWDAKIKWINANGDVIPEHDPNDINLPSIYVTYSMNNMSAVLTGKNTSYTGDPINSVYPVHTATLHFNGIPYHGQNKSFTCFITDLNVRFLQQYNVPDDNLTYSMTVYIRDSSSSALTASSSGDLTSGPIVGIGISSILILAFVFFVIYFCYGKHRQTKRRKLSIQAPFQKLTADLAVDLKIDNNNSKVKFPRENVTLLEKLGEL